MVAIAGEGGVLGHQAGSVGDGYLELSGKGAVHLDGGVGQVQFGVVVDRQIAVEDDGLSGDIGVLIDEPVPVGWRLDAIDGRLACGHQIERRQDGGDEK